MVFVFQGFNVANEAGNAFSLFQKAREAIKLSC